MKTKKPELNLTSEQYLTVLRRMRARFMDEQFRVKGYDDKTPGAKHTECNAGLCTETSEIYSKNMTLFPEQYPQKISPKYRGENLYCPLSKSHQSLGCFNDCLFFQDGLKNKEEIFKLYDERIVELEQELRS